MARQHKTILDSRSNTSQHKTTYNTEVSKEKCCFAAHLPKMSEFCNSSGTQLEDGMAETMLEVDMADTMLDVDMADTMLDRDPADAFLALPRAVVRRSSVVGAERCGITPREFRSLRKQKAPACIFTILACLAHYQYDPDVKIDGVDYFSGVGNIHKAMNSHNLSCLSYDVGNDAELEDFVSPEGFLMAILWALRVCRFGFANWGTVCSTWVWICRATTQRSRCCPLGNETKLAVKQANLMVSRMALVWHLLRMRQVVILLEQPATSLMFAHPRLAYVIHGHMHVVWTWMGAFGASTPKATKLASTHYEVVHPLRRKMTRTVRDRLNTTSYVRHDGSGARKTYGKRKQLKESQAYTPQYADAVAQSYRQWRAKREVEVSSDSGAEVTSDDAHPDAWEDAQVDSVLKVLGCT